MAFRWSKFAERARTAYHSETVESVTSLLKFGAILHCIHEYGVDVTMCVGPSMLPTFNHVGDVVVMERVTPFLRSYTRGDVVIAKSPTNANQTVCKRIRGLEHDTIVLPAQSRHHSSQDIVIKVPPGHVWLEGDNCKNSTDSRYYGPVPAALVKGRVVLKIWPLWEGGFVRSISPKLEEEEIAAREAKNEKTHAAWSSIRRNQNPAHARAKIVYRDEAGGGGGKSWEKAVAAEKAVAEAAAAVAAEEAAKGPAVVGGDASDEAAGVAGAVAGGGGGASTPQEAGLPQEDAYGKKRAAELFRKNGGAEQR